MQLAQYIIPKEDMGLSDDVREELNEILKMATTMGEQNTDVEEACELFFETYGSHVYEGPIRFGGHFWWTCSSSNFSHIEMEILLEMQFKAVYPTTSASISAEERIDMVKESYKEKCSKEALDGTNLHKIVTGCPPETTAVPQWKNELMRSNSMWVVTDRGTKLLPVWEIIQENHDEELGALKALLKNTWVKIAKNDILPDWPLGKVLKTRAMLSKLHARDRILFDNDNCSAHALLDKLGLLEYYPKKLQLQDALCIRSDPLELSLGMSNPTDPKELPYLILQKIMAYDYRCRSDLMHSSNDKSAFSNSFSDSGSDQSDDIDSDDDTILNPKGSGSRNSDDIHPVDGLLAIILCSDDFLRQDLLSRLAKCQIAIPFILPDPFTMELLIPLWAMRSIVKDFKDFKQVPIIKHKMPIVSFIRIGKHTSKCTPKILNEVISGSCHDHFFHHDCPGAQYDIVLGQSLVDMCWYLPAGKPTDTFPYPVTFLNLHGDARDHLEQSLLLSQISSICFLLLTEEVEFSIEIISIIKKFSLSPGGITVFNYGGKVPVVQKANKIKVYDINEQKFNLAEIKDEVQKRIKEAHRTKSFFQSIEECCYLSETKIIVDEKCDTNNIKKVLGFVHKVSEKTTRKKDCIPLQALWKKWAHIDKECYRQTQKGNKSVINYSAELMTKKKKIRKEQLQSAKFLTPLMETFIMYLLKLGGTSNRILRNYFLQSLKLGLNIQSMDKASEKQSQYHAAQERLELQNSPNAMSDCKSCRKEMKIYQQDITDASIGLEHLLQELGQIYEAASKSTEFQNSPISRLSKAAAEILIDGYPLELMDGDVSHVPLTWVTAVIEETVKLLKDPKVYVLSVLGLQSTGKSTMLNTVFGLQFNVSAGRCIHGAFMQLLPVDENLSKQTGFSYVLVVDTEGLRAPELNHSIAQNHDNELVTFVIGLANTTLVNIYGEVPGDIDDILQTSVHAFLRMKQAKRVKPSCQFVHQNAEANKNNEVSHGNFTDKLNEFTVLAAKAEGLQGHYETFNEVIKFEDQNDIFYFPGLWQGDPPMAPVNQGYSISAQMLKHNFMKSLCQGVNVGNDCHLSSFHIKLKEFWDALLKEDFVFSFRNILEITAYNSLETAYMNLEWKFKTAMLDWEQKAKNEISTAADSESVPDLVEKKLKDLAEFLLELYEPLRTELEQLFVGQWSDIIVQWKANFEKRFENLLRDLEDHAEKTCNQLGQSKLAFSRIERERETYIEKITIGVQDIIRDLIQEHEDFDRNLVKGQLNEKQLDELLKADLFTHEKLMRYIEQDFISKEQVKFISELTKQKNGELTRDDLNQIIAVLGKDIAQKLLKKGQTEEQLKEKFEGIWRALLSQIGLRKGESIKIELEVEKMLLQYVKSKGGYDGQLIAKLKKESQKLREWERHALYPEENKHYMKSSWYSELFKSKDKQQVAQEVTTKVLAKASQCLQKITENDIDFNKEFTYQLLRDVDEEIVNQSGSDEVKNTIKFLPEYNIEVYLVVCGCAVPRFEQMSKSFMERHDPLLYLERYVKNPQFTHFKNQVYQIEAEEAIASKFCACLEEPIKVQIENTLVQKIIGEMRTSEKHLSSKMALKVKILTDLHEKDDFNKYLMYIIAVKRSVTDWLEYYTDEYCNRKVDKDTTRLQALFKNEVTRLIYVAEGEVNDVNETDAHKCLSAFCNNMKLRSELGVNFKVDDLRRGYESLTELILDNFKYQIKTGLKKLEEKLHTSCDSITSSKKIVNSRNELHRLCNDLIGCTAQCPFCNEQCDLLDPNHVKNNQKHRTAVHRPSCLGSWRRKSDEVLVIEICPSQVAGGGKFQCPGTDKYHPFKDYQSIFPEWSIPPDVTAEDSKYWMLFVAKYKKELAKQFVAKPPEVPQGWEKNYMGRSE